jgi:hypothetical protein
MMKSSRWVLADSEGRDLSLELRFTDVYVQRGGRWQMVAWPSTRIQ